jgi:hypothetical protein
MTHCLVNHHITGHLVFVLVSIAWDMTSPAIDNPATCEIRAVIHFLHTKNVSAAEIHRELCTVYGQNVIVKEQWSRIFKDGRPNKCSRWRVKWSSGYMQWVMTLFKSLAKNLWKTALHNIRTLTWISTNFTHSSLRDCHSWVRLSQVLRKMGSENAHGCAKNAENGFCFDFFTAIPQRWR